MNDADDYVGDAINALCKAGNLPKLSGMTPFAQQAMRGRMSAILSESYLDGQRDAMESPEGQDTKRLDWLSDPSQSIGNVTLPTKCVENNLHSLRAAIDAAMGLEDRES